MGEALDFSRLWFPHLPVGALGSPCQVSPSSSISETVTPSPSPCGCPAAGLHPSPRHPHPTHTLAHHGGPRSTVCGRTWRGRQDQSLNSHGCPPWGLWAGHSTCRTPAFPSAERGRKARPALPRDGDALCEPALSAWGAAQAGGVGGSSCPPASTPPSRARGWGSSALLSFRSRPGSHCS